MLGYIKTDSSELRMREYQYYRALYCGLCHRMGKCTGNCSRMTLSYDFVFLAAVRLSITGEKPVVQKQRCLLHPIRPRLTVQKCNALDYCADASALLVYHKLLDDLHDEKGLKKARAILLRPFLYAAYRRAKKRRPRLNDAVAEHLTVLSEYENERSEFLGADPPAEQFGRLMAAVFSEGLEGNEARIAANMGHAIGHWIYLVDAADDFEEDRKKGRFNPYLKLFGNDPSEADWEDLKNALTAHLMRAEQSLSLIDGYPAPELREILCNILYLGLVQVGERVTCHTPRKQTQKEIRT